VDAVNVDLPANATWETDLTGEQKTAIATQADEIRIDALSDADRRAEFEPKAESLAIQAGQKKEGSIITGTVEADAITTATAWLDTELRSLWDIYGYTRIGRQYCIDWAGTDIWNQYGIEDV
jgi:hypothetical protein